MHYSIQAYDVGGHTKVIPFQGDDTGRLWFAPEFDVTQPIPRVVTPHDISAQDFMPALQSCLREEGLWQEGNVLRAFSMCSPVVGATCVRMLNRGILKSFTVEATAVLNDGFAATVGSLVAGVARGHTGAIACLTLGTGIGVGSILWDHRGRRVTNDGEAHITIRNGRLPCQCQRESCFEAAANEQALSYYAREAGWDDLDAKKVDIGFMFEAILKEADHPHFMHVKKALTHWHAVLAQGMATMYALLNMGGTPLQPPALFVMAGGLSFLIDEDVLRQAVLNEWGGMSFIGDNFIVRKEKVVGNMAGAIGVAAEALAQTLKKNVFDIRFVTQEPIT